MEKFNPNHLIKIAKDAIKFAQAKYSNFKVSAVLLTSTNEIFTGVNVESSSLGLTICAERVALVKALSEGYSTFTSIVIYAEQKQFCPPCGACRQLLLDYAPQLNIILTDGTNYKTYKLKDLLPVAFSKDYLNENE